MIELKNMHSLQKKGGTPAPKISRECSYKGIAEQGAIVLSTWDFHQKNVRCFIKTQETGGWKNTKNTQKKIYKKYFKTLCPEEVLIGD